MESNAKSQKKTAGKVVFTVLRRTLLSVFTLVMLVLVGLIMVCNLIFNGPSTSARDILTMSMLESSGMKWCPALFIGKDTVEDIRAEVSATLPADMSDTSQIVIQNGSSLGGSSEWDDHPDGIRLEEIKGDTYNAYVMLVRDPSRVYTATCTDDFSTVEYGLPLSAVMETEGAVAGVNGGAFFDDGTASSYVGSTPRGMVVSKGKIVFNDGTSYYGFVGLNEDNVLIVSTSINAQKVKDLRIRDGCCFGPVLVINGEINEAAYNQNSGYNPRTAIGQRADGTIILLCVDGRQVGSLGATYADLTDIMIEYGAVNAMNLDGGSSTVMCRRDPETNQLQVVNSYSLLQESPRRMPTYFLVRPLEEG